MSYDNEGRPATWQNAPGSSPTSTASYLSDGAGQRVQQVATVDGATTTTAYYGGLAESINGALSYLLSDGLGSVSEAISTATGAVTATQLYGPYGAVRYQQGTLPTSKGYTGQRADTATSGLDYYGARYCDPVAGQFASADTTLAGGLNEYAYVGGNPESRTDPSGHHYACPTGMCGTGSSGGSGSGGGSGNPSNPTPTQPTSGGSGSGSGKGGSGDNGGGPVLTSCVGSSLPCWSWQPPTTKCSTLTACDDLKSNVIQALQKARDIDLGAGALMVLASQLLLAILDKDSPLKELSDVIGEMETIANVLPLLIGTIYAPTRSAVAGAITNMARLANAQLGMLYAVRAAVQAYGALSLTYNVVMGGVTIAEGGWGIVLDTVGHMVGDAVLNGTATVGFALLQRGQDEAALADQWGGETTTDWCNSTRACGASISGGS